MDGAADAVGELGVQLGQLVAGVHAGIGDVPHGGGLHDVPDHELLDGLVLGARLGAVGAPDELDMATAMLVTSIVSTLGCHLDSGIKSKYKYIGPGGDAMLQEHLSLRLSTPHHTATISSVFDKT